MPDNFESFSKSERLHIVEFEILKESEMKARIAALTLKQHECFWYPSISKGSSSQQRSQSTVEVKEFETT